MRYPGWHESDSRLILAARFAFSKKDLTKLTHFADKGVLHGAGVVEPVVVLGAPQEGARRLSVLINWVSGGPGIECPCRKGHQESSQIIKPSLHSMRAVLSCHVFNKASLSDYLYMSTTPLNRSLYLGPKRSPRQYHSYSLNPPPP